MGSIVSSLLGGGSTGENKMADELNMTAAQMGEKEYYGIGSGGLGDYRPEFSKMLAEQAMGKAPSIAESALKMAQDRNLAQQVAAAKANRAANPALASRQAAMLGAQQAQQTAQAAGIQKLQERQQQQQAFANWNQQMGQQYLGALGRQQQQQQIKNQGEQFDIQRGDQFTRDIAKGAASAATGVPMMDQPKPAAEGGIVPQSEYDANPNMFAKYYDAGSVSDKSLEQIFQESAKMKKQKNKVSAQANMPQMLAKGAIVPGKPKVSGDSEKNDVVPALLSPGEIVIPRTVAQKGPQAAHDFVAALMSKPKKQQEIGVHKMANGGKVEQPPINSFINVLQAQAELAAEMEKLAKKYGKGGK